MTDFEHLEKDLTSSWDRLSGNPVFKSFLAGSISGTCSTVIFQPLDLLKTRLQISLTAIGPGQSAGLVPLVTNIVQHEQLFGLWKGMTPSLVRCVPGIGLYFSSLHTLKSYWIKHTGKTSVEPYEAGLIGVAARSISGVILIPVTILKTRFESGVYRYKSMTEAFQMIYKVEGPRGLCRGLIPTLFRDAPFSGLYLMFYTRTKQAIPSAWLEGSVSSVSHFSCGVLAGILASFVTQPADVIKTKMQLYPNEFKTITSALIYIHQKHGIEGYFKGLVPRMLRRTLMAAMAWTIYEKITLAIGLK
ncbi:UNVERIFIED_CONTAM: hypothetical protein PYX00_000204 [Menopon gallinae]|uniref:Mitochondrial glycine transporter n=1 Tax=Menopon gallinae TaxID=328185 RepID=A0AAW2I944_9NEOP